MTLTISQSARIAPLAATPSVVSGFRPMLTSLLKAISNCSSELFSPLPAHDFPRALAEAGQLLALPEQTTGEFITGIRNRLKLPQALALMQAEADSESFESLYRWLPAIPQPLLSVDRQRQLIGLALGVPPDRFERENLIARLERSLPALNNLLVDEINRATAESRAGTAGKMLPELLRLKVVNETLQGFHPLLPTIVWAVQLLWQIRQQGMVKALDGELKMHLHQWLTALDGRRASPETARLPLSDKSLWHCIDRWVEQRLNDLRGSDGAQPLVEAARSATVAHPEVRPSSVGVLLPLTARPAFSLSAEGWRHNSVLNSPAEQSASLLMKVRTCYELLKREMQPANFAVACAVRSENSTMVQPDFRAVQFSRSLVRDPAGELHSRLQLESGELPFSLSGAAISGEQRRPLATDPLAEAGDRLMSFPDSEMSLPEQERQRLVFSVLNRSLDLLSSPLRFSGQPLKVEPVAVAPLNNSRTGEKPYDSLLMRPGEMQVEMPLSRGLFNHLLHRGIQQRESVYPSSAEPVSAWPFAGVQGSPVKPSSAILLPQQGVAGAVPLEAFIDSMHFKYPQQLDQSPKVTMSINQTADVMDKEMTLEAALSLMQETESGMKLSLNPNPEWSHSFNIDVRDFILGKFVNNFDMNKPMEWDSPDNMQAAWLIGKGLANKGIEQVVDIINKMTSPVWDVNEWIKTKINFVLQQHGVDTHKFNENTTVLAGVLLPSNHGVYHMPMLHPGFDGSWQQVGKYTLRDIFTREYLRKDHQFNQGSLVLKFPVEISQALQNEIKTSNLQSDYINELGQALSEGDVKVGMLMLFRTVLEKTVDNFLKSNSVKNVPINVDTLRASAARGDFYQLEWNGCKMHNLVFIPAENESQGIIVSIWDDKGWVVSIDPLSTISFYGDGEAKKMLEVINKSISIAIRVNSNAANIIDNQLEINPSGKYVVEFQGKVFIKKYWEMPVAERSIMRLKKSEWIEKDLLTNFVAVLKADMNYLVKSPGEYARDTAIEVLNTIGTLIGLFSIPVAITTSTGTGYMATKLFTSVTSWKSSLAAASTFSIFPGLVKAKTADRPDDVAKAYTDVLLSLMGEGAGQLMSEYGLRLFIGLFRQGNKFVKITLNQLPGAVVSRILHHKNSFFSHYRNDILHIPELLSASPRVGEQYNLPFIDIKAPAPVREVAGELNNFTNFLKAQAAKMPNIMDLFNDPAKMPEIVYLYFQNKGFQVLFGGVARWSSLIDPSPVVHYIVRLKSATPDISSGFSETEDIIIDFSRGRVAQHEAKGEVLSGEEKWLNTFENLPHNKDKAISVEWFDNPQLAIDKYKKMAKSNRMNIVHFTEVMEVRPEWYTYALKRRALLDIETQQAVMLEEIYKIENEIALPDLNDLRRDTLSLKLGVLFTQGTLPAFDALSKKVNILLTKPIGKQVVALPEGNYLLISTELRGLSSDNHGNVTMINFSEPASLLLSDQTYAYPPGEIVEAGQAAVNSSLYASRIDELIMYQEPDTQISLPKKRYAGLKKSSEWLGQRSNDFRVPLIIAVNQPLNGGAEAGKSHSVSNTISAEDIGFVMAPDNLNSAIADILLTLRKTPIPVRSLLIEDSVSLQKTLKLADSYAFFPGDDSALQAFKGYEQQPWMPIINLQASCQFIPEATAQLLRQQTRRDNYRDFIGDEFKPVTSLNDILDAEAGARIAIFALGVGPGKPPMSHAMMMVSDGAAIGANNQVIGGQESWEKIWLGTLNWIQDEKLGFVLDVNGQKLSLAIQQSPSQLTPTEPESKPVINLNTQRALELAQYYTSRPTIRQEKNSGTDELSWVSIIRLYEQVGAINPSRLRELLDNTRPDEYQAFLGHAPQMARSLQELVNAPAGSLLVLTEKPPGRADGKHEMVHAMMISSDGKALGNNNQIIGQQPGWQTVNLTSLEYDADTRFGLVLLVGERRFNGIICPPAGVI